jgi:hypothetical protein
MRIPHFELLHGIGYTPVPWGWDSELPEHLPQGILSLDEVSTATFSSLERVGVKTITVSHPFYSRFYDRAQSLPSEWLIPEDEPTGWSKRILVTFQWGYAGDHGRKTHFEGVLPNGLFYDGLTDVIEQTATSVFWHFRFHPVQLRQPRYRKLRVFMDDYVQSHPNTEWRKASHVPFPSVVSRCDGHLTMTSMSAYDAALFGVKTLFLCPTLQPEGVNQGMFADLEAEGYCARVEYSSSIVLQWTKEVSRLPRRRLVDTKHEVSALDAIRPWLARET